MLWTFGGIVGCLVACSGTTGNTGGADGGSGDGGTGAELIAAKDFDQSCAKDDDCVVVTDGDVCAVCRCPGAAIAKKALDAFNAKRAELSQACGPRPAIACGVDCASFQIVCSAEGKCVAGTHPADAGSDGG